MTDSLYWSTSLVLNFEDASSTTFTDISPSPKTATRHGSAVNSATQFKTGAQSLLLTTASSDYLHYAQDASFDFGTGDFCIEFWWRAVGASDDSALLTYAKPAVATGADLSVVIAHYGATQGGKIRAQVYNGINNYTVDSLAGIAASQWYHVAFVRSAGILALYLDGVQQGTTSCAFTVNAPASPTLRLGVYDTSGTPRYANGNIDGVRITKGYPRYTTNFTPDFTLYVATDPLHSNVSNSMPAPITVANTGPRIAASMPAAVSAMVAGMNVTSAMPMPLAAMAGHDATGENAVTTAMPMGLVSVRLGNTIATGMPSPVAAMSATTTVLVEIATVMPLPAVAAGMTTGSIAQVGAVMPSPASASRFGDNIAAGMPMPATAATGRAGSVAHIAGTMPMPTVAAELTAEAFMVIETIMPMLVGGPYGRVVSAMPMPRTAMAMHTVVAVTYEAYAVNLQPQAGFREQAVHEVTHYTGMEFDHIIRLRNRYYGVKADGVFPLGGDTDAGEPIAWAMHTGIGNLGSRQMKACREAFVHGRVGSGLTAQASIGEAVDRSYDGIVQAGETAQATRAKFGKGLKAVYWSFGLADPDGGPADIDAIQLDAAELTRKVF